MKKFLPLILVLCLLLCACGKESEETTPGTDEVTETTVETTETTEETTEATEEQVQEPVDVNPLTGEALDEVNDSRPYAIMLNNASVSLPHQGVAAADVIYETLVEGGSTRYMAIFCDPTDAGPIGSVRSCRPPYVDLVQCYDAIYTSVSGEQTVLNMIYNAGIDYLNAIYDGKYYYRDSWRQNNMGYEHSMMITGENLIKLAEDNGLRTTREVEEFGFNFDETAPFGGEAVEKIKLWFHAGGKSTTVNYDEESGMFHLYQYGLDYTDGNTGELVDFRNIFILECNAYTLSNGVHVQVETVGEGTGYYARDGKIVPINWSRESVDAPFVYTLEDGTELTMGVGKSYIALIATDGVVEYE